MAGNVDQSAMKRLSLSGWQVAYDRDATLKAFANIVSGGPEICGCDPCRNWAETRESIHPSGFQELLSELGIPMNRESEVYHNCRLESGLHSYGGWYHFVGSIVSGYKELSPNVEYDSFSIYFSSQPALVEEEFANLAVVQLEFSAEVPWMSGVQEAS